MKKWLLFWGLVGLLFPLLGQRVQGLNVGLQVEPHSSGPQDFITEIRDGPNGGRLDEKAKLSFTAGLTGEWNVDSRSAVRLGLLFADRGYQTVWTPNDRMQEPIHTRFRFSYLSMPLTFRYIVARKKVRGYLAAGPLLDVLLHASNAPYNRTFKRMGLAYQISIGAAWQLTEKMDMNIEPVIRQGLTAYNDQRRYSPLSAGIIMGIVLR